MEGLKERDCQELYDKITVELKNAVYKENRISSELDTVLIEYMKLPSDIKKKYYYELVKEFQEALEFVDSWKDLRSYVQTHYYLVSFLLHLTGNPDLFNMIVNECIEADYLTKETKFAMYYQFSRYAFLTPSFLAKSGDEYLYRLYSRVLDEYKKSINKSLAFIHKEERNQNLVFILSNQVVGLLHGPTKTLIDRCRVIEQKLGKKVFIINTAEMLPVHKLLNLFNAMSGNYIEEYNFVNNLNLDGNAYDFFQCPKEMPEGQIIEQILDVIVSEKPYCIINIGGNSIVSDIASQVVPTITLATVFSGRSQTRGQFQVVGHQKTKDDIEWLKNNNLSDDHIIESLFTFVFKEQTHKYTREQLGLPLDGFIVTLVGMRLDQEIDEACEKMLIDLTKEGIYVVFVGEFDRYYEIVKKEPTFEKYAINLGKQDDVLAIDECCDLYVNPKRLGGGTSVAEALYKGLPAVTFDYGDVGVTAGKAFHISSYQEMYEKIVEYSKDKELYNKMSYIAKERGRRLLDSDTEFVRVMKEIEKSPRF